MGHVVVSKDKFGIPIASKQEIEYLFTQVKKGAVEPSKLKQELDRWGLFKAYEDRFFDLFRRNKWNNSQSDKTVWSVFFEDKYVVLVSGFSMQI